MKSTLLILFLVFLTLFSNAYLFSQQFFPLNTGNKFIYQYSSGYKLVCKITKDTIIANKKYYYIIYLDIAPNGWFRVDSITGSLYIYDENNSCEYYYKENLVDSLQMGLNGVENDCSSYVVNDITQIMRWGQQSTEKTFHKETYPGPDQYDRKYSSFFGFVYDYWRHFTGYGWVETSLTLKGCIINNIMYGDTTVVGINDKNSVLGTDYFLSQNYPNPFNPSTKIKFDVAPHTPYPLSRGEIVTLKVYDILGKEITTLVNEQLQPGTYEVTFDGSNLPSGIYFYKLTVGNYIETKKMLMIK